MSRAAKSPSAPRLRRIPAAYTARSDGTRRYSQLMDRAEQSAGGSFVNVVAYGPDYQSASEELQLIEHAAQTKNCLGGPNWPSNSAVR
jgi:hypothetical protein